MPTLTRLTRVSCYVMNISQIEEAAHRGVPFALKVADGDSFLVPHPDYISFPPKNAAKRTYVIVYRDDGIASLLPLLTITSLTYRESEDAESPP